LTEAFGKGATMQKYFLILENEPLTLEWLQQILRRYFSEFQMIGLETEKSFREITSEFSRPPAIAILGMRVRWQYPEENMQLPPDDVREGSYTLAGRRCWKLLRENPVTKQMPIIFHTVIDESRNAGSEILSDPNTRLLEMRDSEDSLIQNIQELLAHAH